MQRTILPTSLVLLTAARAAAFAPATGAAGLGGRTTLNRISRRAPGVCGIRASQSLSSSATKQAFAVDAKPAPGQPFHLAFPVRDIEEAKAFYGGILGLPQGRIAPGKWVDYSLNGHQIVCHWVGNDYKAPEYYNPVDGDDVPVPHFGLALNEEQFHELAKKVQAAGIKFIVEPHLRFKGAPGEQWTMFFQDPSGNSLEFKSMTNPENLFARYDVHV